MRREEKLELASMLDTCMTNIRENKNRITTIALLSAVRQTLISDAKDPK